MTRVVLQAGHCHRKTGATGTRSASGFTEQQFAWSVANRAADKLRADGHGAIVIEADVPDGAYRGDVFVAIHCDGSANPSVRGASVGHRTNDGKVLAAAWKGAYANLGWPGGFRADNYTPALGGYYGVKKAVRQGNTRACIVEAGFLTHPGEAVILASPAGQDRCAEAIRRAVNATLGTQAIPDLGALDMAALDDKTLQGLVIITWLAALHRRPPLTRIAEGVEAIKRDGLAAYAASITNSPEGQAVIPPKDGD